MIAQLLYSLAFLLIHESCSDGVSRRCLYQSRGLNINTVAARKNRANGHNSAIKVNLIFLKCTRSAHVCAQQSTREHIYITHASKLHARIQIFSYFQVGCCTFIYSVSFSDVLVGCCCPTTGLPSSDINLYNCTFRYHWLSFYSLT